MRKIALITLMIGGLAGTSVSASASDHQYNNTGRAAYGFWGWRTMQVEMNNLNRMRGHVRFMLGNYHGGSKFRQQYWSVSHDIDRLNDEFKKGRRDRYMWSEIQRLRNALHDIEVKLEVKRRDIYKWD